MNDLPGDVQQRIDQYLDEIDAVLADRGMTRSKRSAVVDAVQKRITHRLSLRVMGMPRVTDAQAILAELDPPQAYAAAASSDSRAMKAAVPRTKPRLSRKAVVGLVLLIVSLPYVIATSVLLIGMAYAYYEKYGGNTPVILGIVYLVFLIALPVAATWLGVSAVRQIRQSQGKIYGLGLAVFQALFYPMIFLDALIIYPLMLLASEAPPTLSTGLYLLMTGVVIVSNLMMAITAVRFVSGPQRRFSFFDTGALSYCFFLLGMLLLSVLLMMHPNLSQAARSDGVFLLSAFGFLLLFSVISGMQAWRSALGKLGMALSTILLLAIFSLALTHG